MATVPILLKFSRVQNAIIHTVTYEFSKEVKTKVQIGSVDYQLFNAIALHDIYVEDLSHDSLLYVNKAAAKFNFWKMFKGKVVFTGIELDDMHANIKLDSSGKTNFDFILQALTNKSKKDTTGVLYKIKDIRIRHSFVHFSKPETPSLKNNKTLNLNNLNISYLNAHLRLNLLDKDSLSAEIKSLSFKEKSGLNVKDVSAQLIATKEEAKLSSVKLEMPDSKINFSKVEVKYDSLSDLKNFSRKVKLYVPLQDSYVSLNDLSAIIPEFKGVHHSVKLKGVLSGSLSNLKINHFELNYGSSVYLNADIELTGLPDIEEAFLYTRINELKAEKSDIQDLLSDINHKPVILPDELTRLGNVSYKGNITGFFSNLVLYGNLKTNMGKLTTDILLQFSNKMRDLNFNGTIKSDTFQLGKVLNNSKVGDVSFNLNTNGSKLFKHALKGNIVAKINEFNFNQYPYRDVKFDGKFDGKGFDGAITLADKNIDANFKGVIDLTQKLPVFNFNLKVKNVNLNALHLIPKYPGSTLAFNARTNMVGNSLDNLNGFIDVNSISFKNKQKDLKLSDIRFVSKTDSDLTNFSVSSNYLNGSFSGNFKYSLINRTFNKLLYAYLPSLATEEKPIKGATNKINVDLKLKVSKDMTDVLDLPYEVSGISTLKGTIDETSNKVSLNATVPSVDMSRFSFKNITFRVENPKNHLKLTTRAQVSNKRETLFMFLTSTAANDSVETNLGWQNAEEITNAGEIQTITKLRNDSGNIGATVSVLPTQVIISDSIWNVRPSEIDVNIDSSVVIHNFRFENQKQYIHINGKLSKNANDTLGIAMNQIDLNYVMSVVGLRGISIGGIVTGKASLCGFFKKPIFLANLDVKNVTLNDKEIADAKVISTWDNKSGQMLLGGQFFNPARDTIATAKGIFNPLKDSIDVTYFAHGVSLTFLSRYFDKVVSNLQGTGYGTFRMFGPLKKIGFEGKVFADHMQMKVNTLQTTYFFSDTIRLEHKLIVLDSIKLYDEDSTQAVLNGTIHHDGGFGDLRYDVNIQGNNILAMNTHSNDNDYFYGKVYANGTVNITGDENQANILVNAVSEPNTKCYISMGGASTASDNSFIQFVNPRSTYQYKPKPKKEENIEDGFNVNVDLRVSATPDAEMEMIVDPKGGDNITGRGSGNLRVQFDTFSDVKLFGNYTFDEGDYLFTLQTVIRKKFSINKGSSIIWTGDPFGAKVNIQAIYSLSASLSDLSTELSTTTNRANVPVNCVLTLTDDLMKPTIKFDIDLPQSDEGVKQTVKSIINTNDMMNREIASLLVLNKFYSVNNTFSGVDEGLSLVTSTLSSQINNWVQQSLNLSNFSLGVDMKMNQVNLDEVKADLNYQPNNRIIMYGNIGYRNDNINTSTNANKFIGNFDIEYLLSNAGKIRIKAYSHTVDRSELKEAKTTQGVGFIYKEDFDSFADMMKYYWSALTGKNKRSKK